jgi:hypothetical protein
MANSEVTQMELHIEDAKRLVEQRDLALKLYNDPTFKKLVLESYCIQDCARFAQQGGDPVLTAEQRADATAMAQAAGHFRRWLSQCVQMGNAVAAKMDEMEEELEAARQEESN